MSETTATSPDRSTTHRLTWPNVVLVLFLGALLGLFGGFLQAVVVRIGSVPVPMGAVLVLACLVAAIRAVIHMFDTRRAGVSLLLGWLASSVLLALPGPGGDVVLTSQPQALGYLFGGVVLGTAAANIPARLRPPAPEPA